ncbi:MAG: hypothetical protein ACREPT_08085 [Rudaea sp.]
MSKFLWLFSCTTTTEMPGVSVALAAFGNILRGHGGGASLPALSADHVFADSKPWACR